MFPASGSLSTVEVKVTAPNLHSSCLLIEKPEWSGEGSAQYKNMCSACARLSVQSRGREEKPNLKAKKWSRMITGW